MNPDDARAWGRILRDLVIVAVGAFILLHEEFGRGSPDPILIAAGLTMLGLPPALRADEWRFGRKGNGQEK